LLENYNFLTSQIREGQIMPVAKKKTAAKKKTTAKKTTKAKAKKKTKK